MALGINSKHTETILLGNLSSDQFLALAAEAIKKLNWSLKFISNKGLIAFTPLSMSSWSEEIQIKFESSHILIKSSCTGSQIIDWGKNKRNVSKFIETFEEIKKVTTEEELNKKVEELKSMLLLEEANLFDEKPETLKEKLNSALSIFIPREGYFFTPIIIIVNILIFILMVISGVDAFSPDTDSLLLWGANFRPITLEGEHWRLLTSCFLHIGIFHLLMNMYALLYIGLLLEPYLGKLRFITAYVLTGILASLTSLWWHEFTVSAGASGAIFGMYGLFLSMLTTNLIEKGERQSMLSSIGLFVGYNLLIGMKGDVDNAAHIGGLISGIIIGYLFYPGLKKPGLTSLKNGAVLLITVLVLFISYIVLNSIPNYLGLYDKGMEKFLAMEKEALEIYNMPDLTNDELFSHVQKKGIPNWEESISLITELDKMDLPVHIHERNKKLLHYCDLRLKSYESIIFYIAENNDLYKNKIDSLNVEIEAALSDLSME